jgi:hypothetical protein
MVPHPHWDQAAHPGPGAGKAAAGMGREDLGVCSFYCGTGSLVWEPTSFARGSKSG